MQTIIFYYILMELLIYLVLLAVKINHYGN